MENLTGTLCAICQGRDGRHYTDCMLVKEPWGLAGSGQWRDVLVRTEKSLSKFCDAVVANNNTAGAEAIHEAATLVLELRTLLAAPPAGGSGAWHDGSDGLNSLSGHALGSRRNGRCYPASSALTLRYPPPQFLDNGGAVIDTAFPCTCNEHSPMKSSSDPDPWIRIRSNWSESICAAQATFQKKEVPTETGEISRTSTATGASHVESGAGLASAHCPKCGHSNPIIWTHKNNTNIVKCICGYEVECKELADFKKFFTFPQLDKK